LLTPDQITEHSSKVLALCTDLHPKSASDKSGSAERLRLEFHLVADVLESGSPPQHSARCDPDASVRLRCARLSVRSGQIKFKSAIHAHLHIYGETLPLGEPIRRFTTIDKINGMTVEEIAEKHRS
jgi:hypothetical protein